MLFVVYLLSRVHLFATPWTATHQSPLSMGFPKQKSTGVGCHFLLQGNFLTQRYNPCHLYWQVDSYCWTTRETQSTDWRIKVLHFFQESDSVSLSVVSDSFATPWTAVHQAPLSMGFPRQEYWTGLTFSSSGNLPHPEIAPEAPILQADSAFWATRNFFQCYFEILFQSEVAQ